MNPLKITPNAYVVAPHGDFCMCTYSCTVQSGPAVGHFPNCEFTDGDNSGTLSTSTGLWTFISLKPLDPSYPPGDYTIRITGTAGTNNDVTAFNDFTVTFVDPCPTSLSISNPFSDETYTLRDTPMQQSFAAGLTSSSTQADCGTLSYKFYLLDALNTETEIPQDDSDQVIQIYPANELLQIGYTEETSIAELSYVVKYEVFLDSYPGVSVKSGPITYFINDPCRPPASIGFDPAITG